MDTVLEAIPYLTSGVVLGLSAGFSPGPLFTLVISETVRHGVREGVKVAFAPILTDFPIVLVTVLIIGRLSNIQGFLGALYLVGATFLGYLGWESVTSRRQPTGGGDASPRSVRKGIMANVLNPHPYMFWLTIGAPHVLKASDRGLLAPALFLSGFYGLLVGSKIFVAVLTGKSKSFLGGAAHVSIIRCLGVLLWGFAVLFVREGLRALGFA